MVPGPFVLDINYEKIKGCDMNRKQKKNVEYVSEYVLEHEKHKTKRIL